ncbi:hypothetical protein BT69DRAFT_1280132 [Atractiella rhizophila]|nr:hypothetical protein BT69DRAFT_1280132 [Atractiella rhizophila]
MKHKAHLMLGNPESKMGSGSSSGESTVCPSTASSDEMEAMRLGLSNGEENRVAFRRALGIVGGRRAKGTPYPVTRMDANSWLDEDEDDEETDEVGDSVKAVTIE